MRPNQIVVAAPFFERLAWLHRRGEQGLVQKFVAQASVEAFDEGVRNRLSGIDIGPIDLGLLGPAKDGVARQLGAVVADDVLGRPRHAIKRASSRAALRPESGVAAATVRAASGVGGIVDHEAVQIAAAGA